jgi:fumarate reductase subunit C
MTMRLYLLQRLTAALMVPLIVGHLIGIMYATRKGISAADILARTRGSVTYAVFYGTFVLAAAMHAGIGIRNVLREWGPAWLANAERRLDAVMWGAGLILAALGLRAVYAVVA